MTDWLVTGGLYVFIILQHKGYLCHDSQLHKGENETFDEYYQYHSNLLSYKEVWAKIYKKNLINEHNNLVNTIARQQKTIL